MTLFRKVTVAAVATLTMSAGVLASVESANAGSRGWRAHHRHHVKHARPHVRYVIRYVRPVATVAGVEEVVATDRKGNTEVEFFPIVAGVASFGLIGHHPIWGKSVSIVGGGEVVATDRVAATVKGGRPCNVKQRVYDGVTKQFLGYQTTVMICS